MNKRGILFLSFSTIILILSMYLQINVINNDVRTYNEQSRYMNTTNIREIPFEVFEDTHIYISYDSNCKGGTRHFKIVDEANNTIMTESAEDIDIFKKKVKVDKGNYNIVIELDDIEEVKQQIKVIYRREEVDFKTNKNPVESM